ncbi:putative autophagy-related protein 12 [Fimicolochytrium jonesii]|uniref:putative autophagy-related protein 12 n=1 Tax=Fimicolochytrium jonesii TaxID=1396493 RepID=UPI0022FE06C7|nr:putative autophagy-related protein 12 [Fimicolochytrium jonesii]KAI8826807.1 putative autophagy-related protein 12 [Fimicolochytrium jonesii]
MSANAPETPVAATLPSPPSRRPSSASAAATKVVVRFRATGSAPILKQAFFKISASQKFQTVINFLKKELNYKPQDVLFLYVNSSFAPAPDEIVGNLYKCFGAEGNLIVNYSTTAAWG